MKKRVLSLIVGLCLSLTLLPAKTVAANNTSGSLNNFSRTKYYPAGLFTDVPEDSWYAADVQNAYEYGLVSGNSGRTYNPNGYITLAESITLASRIHSIFVGDGQSFTLGQPWYQVYVDYAIANNIIKNSDYSDYTLPASRAQFALILGSALPDVALAAKNDLADDMIPDVKMGTAWASKVYLLYRAGVLVGNDEYGSFGPTTNIQRNAVAAIVNRMVNPSVRQVLSINQNDVVLFAEDGRMIHVKPSDMGQYQELGWVKTPPDWSAFVKHDNGEWAIHKGYSKLSDSKSLYICRGVKTISLYSGFFNESKLSYVEIPDTVTQISERAFQNCSLTRIGIPSSVSYIDYCSFSTYGGINVGAGTCSNIHLVIYCEKGSEAESFAKANDIPYVYASMVYSLDGRTCMATADERAVLLSNGWYDHPVTGVLLYALDGRTKLVPKENVAAEQQNGWLLYVDFLCALAERVVTDSGYTQIGYKNAVDFLADKRSGLEDWEITKITAKRDYLLAGWMSAIGCPVAITGYTVGDYYGTPRLYIQFYNLSNKVINRLDITWTCLDAYGKPTSDYYYNSPTISGYMNNISFGPGENTICHWDLYSNEETSKISNYYITGVAYSDGTSWSR